MSEHAARKACGCRCHGGHVGTACRKNRCHECHIYLLTDESGSASGSLVAFLCWALTIAMLLFVLLAWFAPAPRADATRIVYGAPVKDYCPNVPGVQSVHEVVRHVWVIKVKRGHGPRAGEVTCKPRRHGHGAR